MNFKVVYTLLGASASLFLILPEIKKIHSRKIKRQKLKILREAMEQAEQRLIAYAERHDRILDQICSSYLVNQSLQEASDAARDYMLQASELAVALGMLQLEIINSFF